MAEDRELTRKELADLVREQAEMIAELRTRPAVAASDPVQVEILKALKELKESNARIAPAPAFYTGKPIKTEPYRGYVKALSMCQMTHMGPGGKPEVHVHQEGAVFQVDVDALWSDDPYVPVEITGYEDDAQSKPITKEHSTATQADFRFRRQVELEDKPSLRRASEY